LRTEFETSKKLGRKPWQDCQQLQFGCGGQQGRRCRFSDRLEFAEEVLNLAVQTFSFAGIGI
jgi:hypothetical protein